MPPVVDHDEWQRSLETQQALERDLVERTKAAAAARRKLPMTPVQGEYTFTGAEGEVSFADLFAGKHQLVVYHFMFGPDWKAGCPSCTQYMKELGNDFAPYIEDRDTRFVLISRADISKLQAHAEANDIATPWYSCSTEFSQEMELLADQPSDLPAFTTFFRDENNVIYRTYRPEMDAEPRVAGDLILHLTPYGLQLKGDDSPEGWPQSFDEY